ncbi:hypothetical protein [Maritalea sp.]|uniref:hypothetical protein n=1 Tax=Maritalea sp. TaxID=2003361 RepID=UPI0039E6F23C
MSKRDRRRFERQFDRIERLVPDVARRAMRWLRNPYGRLIRIPLGVLLVLGGILSILPLLGIWMLPLGLLLLAIDIPFLQRPVGQWIIRLRRWWENWRRPK